MIEAKEAAVNAARYFKELTGYLDRVTVEEVEFDDATQNWLITLGYIEEPEKAIFGESKKANKVFRVDANSGKVISMKIRDLMIGSICP